MVNAISGQSVQSQYVNDKATQAPKAADPVSGSAPASKAVQTPAPAPSLSYNPVKEAHETRAAESKEGAAEKLMEAMHQLSSQESSKAQTGATQPAAVAAELGIKTYQAAGK